MIDISPIFTNFYLKVSELEKDISVIVASVNKISRDHYDEDYIQHTSFIKDIDRLQDNEFVNLYQSAVITLFTYLESTIKDIIKQIFIHLNDQNQLYKIPEVAKLNISLAEYISLSDDEKFDYLATEFEKKTAVGISYSVERFEKLLAPLNLSGEVNQDIKIRIKELAQIRNSLIHKAGTVDIHFLKNCPWLLSEYKSGDQLTITENMLNTWTVSAIDYCKIVEARVKVFLSKNFNVSP